MTQHHNRGTKSSNPTAVQHGASQPPSEHPLFKGMDAFEAAMLRVAMQDLHEDGSGSRPFIAATAELAPEARRDLLIRASAALLGHCDHHGAAECLKHGFGLEHLEPSDELDRAIEAGLQILAETADDDDLEDDDDDDLEDMPERVEEFIRIIEEDHQSPQASPSAGEETDAFGPCTHTSAGASPKTTYRRIFEFIDAHQGCLTRDITRHMNRNVRKYLDEMDRSQLIVRVTKRDKYACSDGREKRHYTADEHVGHIGRYGVGG